MNTDKKNKRLDPLVECLAILCNLDERKFSAQAALAGLPLEENRLTPSLFPRAAQRVGYSARLVSRRLSRIPNMVLPAVLILEDNQACVVTAINSKNADVIFPETGMGHKEIPLDKLKEKYSGYVIFSSPQYDVDSRAEQFYKIKPKSWFWGTLFNYKRIYIHVLIAAFLTNLFVLVAPLFIMNVYDRVIPNNTYETLWVLAIGAVTFFVFDLIARTLRSYLIDLAGKKADVILAGRMFEHTMELQMAKKPKSAGAFSSYFQEFETLRDFFTSATLIGLIDLPFILLFLAAVWFFAGSVVIIPMIAVPIVIISALLLEIPTHQAVRSSVYGNAQKQAVLIESLTGLEAVKTLAIEGTMQKKWENIVARTSNSATRSRFYSSFASNFTIWVQQLVTISVVVFGVYLIGQGQLTIGALIAATILSGRAVMLGQVTNLLTRLSRTRAALQGLNKIMALPSERDPKKTYLHRPHIKGDIHFENVNFFYPEDRSAALAHASFSIKAGEKVGIIGRIGSGKSTLLKLIINLYTPDEGEVFIDDTDSAEIDPADLRHNIHYVSNESPLFYGSVRENITLTNPNVDNETFLHAVRSTGVDRFVARNPEGYDMVIGERGETLSGGQRQSIALARAIVSDPSVLLLDEPTASMDHSSEQEFMANLPDFIKDKTLLLVTHRASLLALVGRLIVLEAGRIVADGPKDKVLEILHRKED